MTVNVGPVRLLGANTLLGASQLTGQGNTNTAHDVEWEVLFSTDDAAVSIPSWTYLSQMRGFSVNRGRGSELDDVDAGTATITLDNRSRTFDPTNTSGSFYPNLRPMNRVWLRMRFNGLTHDLFKGWVESYEQQYPEAGLDAVTVVHAVDEFKVLALNNQPTSDPPRDSYADVVQFDNPTAYWAMSDDQASLAERATVGFDMTTPVSASSAGTGLTDGAVAGDNPNPYAAVQFATTDFMETDDTLDVLNGTAQVTFEMWFQPAAVAPGAAYTVFRTSNINWYFQLETSGNLSFNVQNSVGTNFAASASISAGVWTHVVGLFDGTNVKLYLNGSQAASTAFSGTWNSSVQIGSIRVGSGSSTAILNFDEVAVYRYALTADRILAHYNAGVNRGFARGQNAGERIGHLLDAISSQAPRALGAGTRPLAGQWTGNGQATLEAVREAENAEAVDAVAFIAKDGTVTFLDAGHRSTSPWNTVQATFGDAGGTEFDFMDIQVDFSDSFIANEWNVTRDGGTTQSTSDSTSQTSYLKRPQSLTGLKLRDDSDALDVATDMLAKYKDPLTRVLSITPNTMKTDVIDAVFQLEIGDRISVKLTPLGGGARFDQTLFVQSIAIDVTAAQVYPRVTLGVSPV